MAKLKKEQRKRRKEEEELKREIARQGTTVG
jgi:hypothetical protein